MRKFFYLAVISCSLFTGCGPKAEVMVTEDVSSLEVKPSQVQAVTVDSATAGGVQGRVVFEGTVPPAEKLAVQGNPECAVFHPGGNILSEELLVQGGSVQNAFVYVKEGLEGRPFSPPAAPVTVDNRTCIYMPHVVGVQVGQPLVLLNSDATLHNVHSYSKTNKSWNIGLPIQGMKQTKKFETPEVMVMLKCDVHPWMKGYIGVLDHPYYQVTGADGFFELKNLPPGEYVIEAWHEKLGVQSQQVKIEPQSVQSIEFTFRS